MDGTILDSLNDIVAVLNYTLKKFNLPCVTRAQAQRYIGNGARELVRLSLGSNNEYLLDEILPFYKTEYAKSENGLSSLYEGEEKALLNLKSKGLKLAVLTNKPHEAALKANEIFFKKFDFDCVMGQTEQTPLKPNPQAVYAILNKLGVSASDCVFVGDGEADIKTAQNARLDCISVLWGYRSKEQLLSAGANRFVKSFAELEQEIIGKNFL